MLWWSRGWSHRTDIPDLHGKVAIVTGGNQGLGYSNVKWLALAGAKVYMGSRSETRGQEAIDALRRESPEIKEGTVVLLKLELASIKGIIAAADEVKKKETRLDILVNNACPYPEGFEQTDAGFEMTMGVTHVGHFVLVDQLLALMKKTALQPNSDVRIVTLSSPAHHGFVPGNYAYDFSTPESLTQAGNPPPPGCIWTPNLFQYGLAKGANILFAMELQRRLDKDKVEIISTSVSPGGVVTTGNPNFFYSWFLPIIRLTFVMPDQGAITQLFAAVAPEVKEKKSAFAGQYIVPPGKVAAPRHDMMDEKVARDLWETTRSLVNKYLVANGLDELTM